MGFFYVMLGRVMVELKSLMAWSKFLRRINSNFIAKFIYLFSVSTSKSAQTQAYGVEECVFHVFDIYEKYYVSAFGLRSAVLLKIAVNYVVIGSDKRACSIVMGFIRSVD
jgi:hypothetical protein